MPLYVIATPIGNLSDVSERGRDVLNRAEVIYAEDTRHSGKLLQHLGIKGRLRAYHDHADERRRDELLDHVRAGRDVALISDAGTPCIADPGYKVVSAARAEGLSVVPIPGPSAIIAFLSAAGLPTDRFRFVGFAPRKTKARDAAVRVWLTDPATVVVYESPKRVLALVDAIAAGAPSRPTVVARELTKMHEEWFTGTASDVVDAMRASEQLRGEFVVGFAGRDDAPATDADTQAWVDALAATSLSPRDAARVLSSQLSLTSSEAYAAVLQTRKRSSVD